MTRLVWPLLPPVGRTGKAGVIHFFHRMAADIFNEAMAVLGEPAWHPVRKTGPVPVFPY